MKRMIVISGGSGAGKSTLARHLSNTFRESAALFRLEDYYLDFDDIPIRYGDRPNLDVIEAFDIQALHSVLADWKADDTAPHLAFFEGFIAGHAIPNWSDVEVRRLYLDAPHNLRFSRRQGQMVDKEYEKNVLIPMHNKYVEVQKKIADLVINVTDLSPEEVESIAMEKLGLNSMRGTI